MTLSATKRRCVKLVLLCLAMAVLVGSGFISSVEEFSTTAISGDGTVLPYVYGEVAYFDQACGMTKKPFSFTVSPENLDHLISLAKQGEELTQQYYIDCQTYLYLGGTPPPMGPVPVRTELVGYLAEINLEINNARPIRITSLSGKVSGRNVESGNVLSSPTLRPNVGAGDSEIRFEAIDCDVHCHLNAKVMLPLDAASPPLVLDLAIGAQVALTWEFSTMKFGIAIVQRTMSISVQCDVAHGRLKLEPVSN